MLALRQNVARAFRHRDFRLLWFGAFLSFVGSWIQNIAQGYLVYELTNDEAKLALVSFAGMAPVSVLGPFAGTLADTFDKRKLLVIAQSLYALGALFLMVATNYGFVQYWHILGVALMFGVVGSIEMPARQSIISRVVPPEDLPAAIPLNAMTFNFARIFGPAVGAMLLAQFGAQACYGINGISYLCLIFAVLAIHTDLRAVAREPQPIGDLLFEGMRYTFRDVRLKTLFIMESTTSAFGLFYLPMMPAIVKDLLGLGEKGLGGAMTAVGIGAVCGLVLNTFMADRPYRGKIVQVSMALFGVAMFAMSFTRTPYLAFPMFALMGGAAIMQFNTTNTLFQVLSPEHLRGRVLAMHIWALSGLGPFGMLFLGWLSRQTKSATTWTIDSWSFRVPAGGLPFTLKLGAGCVLAGALWSFVNRRNLKDVD